MASYVPSVAGAGAHAPIVIETNLGFTPANGVSAGSGTVADPYVIEGLKIDVGVDGGSGVVITNTTAAVVLRNITVSSSNYSVAAVAISNAAHVSIEGGSFVGLYSGVNIDGGQGASVSGTLFENVSYPLYADATVIDAFDDNRIVGQSGSSLDIGENSSITMRRNFAENGSLYFQAQSLAFESNVFSNWTFSFNSASGNYSNYLIWPNNTVNGQPLRLFKDDPSLALTAGEAGYIIAINCTSAVFSGLHVAAGGTVLVLQSPGARVDSNSFDPGALPPSIYGSDGAAVDGNVFGGAQGADLWVSASKGARVLNNTWHGPWDFRIQAFYLEGAEVAGNHADAGGFIDSIYSQNITVSGNTFGAGAASRIGLEEAENASVSNNSVSGGRPALYVEASSNVNVEGNSIEGPGPNEFYWQSGNTVEISSSSHVLFANNSVVGGEHGISFSQSDVLVRGNRIDGANQSGASIGPFNSLDFLENSFNATRHNVEIHGGSDLRFEGNSFYGGGIGFYPIWPLGWPNLSVGPNNTVGGLPLVHDSACDGSPLRGPAFGQYIAGNCISLGLEDYTNRLTPSSIVLFNISNVRVSNFSVVGGREDTIWIHSAARVELSNVTVRGARGVALGIYSTTNVSLVHGFLQSSEAGAEVELGSVDGAMVANSTFWGGGKGLMLDNCANVSVKGSWFQDLRVGIHGWISQGTWVNSSVFENISNASTLWQMSNTVRILGNRFANGSKAIDVESSDLVHVGYNLFEHNAAVYEGSAWELWFWGNTEHNTTALLFNFSRGWAAVYANNFWSGADVRAGPNATLNFYWGPYTGGNFWNGTTGPDRCHGFGQDDCSGGDGFIDDSRLVVGKTRDWAPRLSPYSDRDRDGPDDGWEVNHGLNPDDAGDAGLDPDGDGVTNIDEWLQGTDPRNPDTNGNGTQDGREWCGWCYWGNSSFFDPYVLTVIYGTVLAVIFAVAAMGFVFMRRRPPSSAPPPFEDVSAPKAAVVPRVVEQPPPPQPPR